MDMEVFAGKICTAVEKELGREFRTEVNEVRKNNGILLHGLLISSKGETVVPTIYLERFLEAYESGMPFKEVVNRVLSAYRESSAGRIDMEFFKSFEDVRDRICYRLIGRKGNEELLDGIPYIEFLDLAICFYYSYHGEQLGDGTILIHNSHMEMWETCTAELFGLAKRNTRRLFPWECKGMGEVLQEMADSGEGADVEEPEGTFCGIAMKILTNSRKTHGAACILYPGVLDGVAQEIGSDFFILPSSIHEVILLPVTGNEDHEKLKEMIREVNSTQVAPEEVLSDTLYRYDRADERVVMV